MQIFISYSSKDQKEAFKVCELLEKNGKKCFIAPRDIRMGREYGEEIVDGIDGSEMMILLLSNNSNQSPHVLREVERAVSKNIPILTCKLEDVELSKSMEYFLMTHQWGNIGATGDYSKLVDWVNQVIKDSVNAPVTQPVKETKVKVGKNRIPLFCCLGILAVLIVLGVVWLFKGMPGKTSIASVSVGDTITLGTYNGEPISWRVLKIKEENQAVLISKDILTMKAYDAAEGGKYNWFEDITYWGRETEADTDMELQATVRGNSDWSVSNIRTWLNSAEEVVTYNDQPPRTTAMAESKNGYHNEPGFLYYFTDEELAAIVETENVTKANALNETETISTVDKVYLLSMEELQWFDDAGISKLAVPTQAAVEQDQSNWYAIDKDTYGIEEYCWWLREPVAEMASKCYLVWNGYWEENIRQENAGLEGYGVRPAITVDLSADILCEMYGAVD